MYLLALLLALLLCARLGLSLLSTRLHLQQLSCCVLCRLLSSICGCKLRCTCSCQPGSLQSACSTCSLAHWMHALETGPCLWAHTATPKLVARACLSVANGTMQALQELSHPLLQWRRSSSIVFSVLQVGRLAIHLGLCTSCPHTSRMLAGSSHADLPATNASSSSWATL